MKVKEYVNGKIVIRTLNEEEIAKRKEREDRFEEQQKNVPPTEAERLEAVEAAILELAEVLANG